MTAGERFGDYTVVRLLGRGGMGEVWLLKSDSGRLVAAKILSRGESANHEARKRFLREAELALGVRHPNLVEVYDVGEDPESGLCYILMEYVAGGTLSDYLKAHGRLSIEDAVAVVEAIAGVLELGRQKGIVHRDIKPANIMFAEDGTPKLADLGIARGGSSGTDTTTVTQTGMMIGTPAYMAPEQMLDAHTVDTRADIYSLGVVFFEMLTGERPNKDDTVVQLMAKAVKGEPLPDVRTLRPEVSASLAQLLNMMVAPDKDGRISTPGQITTALDIIERGGTFAQAAPPHATGRLEGGPSASPGRTEPKSGFPWSTLIVIGMLAALAAAFVLCMPQKQTTRPVVATNVIERIVENASVVTNTIVVGEPQPPPVAVELQKNKEIERPQISTNAFRIKLIGVAVVSYPHQDGVNFLLPTQALEVPFGQMVLFKLEYDFPTTCGARIWTRPDGPPGLTRGKVSFGGNPSGFYRGQGVATGFLDLVKAKEPYRLRSLAIRTRTDLPLEGVAGDWVMARFPVDITFLAQQAKMPQVKWGAADSQAWIVVEKDLKRPPVVRICFDQSHGGSINEDGAFYLSFLSEEKWFAHKACWYGLENENLSHVNSVVLPPSHDRIPYLPEERKALRTFLDKGGTVFAVVDGNKNNLANSQSLLSEYGLAVVSRGAARDDAQRQKVKVLAATLEDIGNIDYVLSGEAGVVSGQDGSAWAALIETEKGVPVLASRSVGKGRLVFASAGLCFAKDKMDLHPGNCRLWRRLLFSAAAAKRISPKSDIVVRDVLAAPCTKTVGPLTFYYAARWKDDAARIGECVQKSLPVLKEMGIANLTPNQLNFSNVALLGTGNWHWYWNGGKKQMIGIHWGGYPERPGELIERIIANMLNGVVWSPDWSSDKIPWNDYLGLYCLTQIGLTGEYDRILGRGATGVYWRYCRAFDAIRKDCPEFPRSFSRVWTRVSQNASAVTFFATLSKAIERDCRPYFKKEGLSIPALETEEGGKNGAEKAAFSEKEMARMKGLVGDKAVQKALDRLFPGWRASSCAGVADEGWNRVGYALELCGRRNICCTLPKSDREPAQLTKMVAVPKTGAELLFSVRKTPYGDSGFALELMVDGKVVKKYRVDDGAWHDETFDLSPWKGKKIRLKLVQSKIPELLYPRALWSRLEVK